MNREKSDETLRLDQTWTKDDCLKADLEEKIYLKQQAETKKYFEENATEWGISSKLDKNINMIKQRNDFVISHSGNVNTFLDIGCGTGDLVFAIAKKGIEALGIDFSESMVNESTKLTKGINNAQFIYADFFDFNNSKTYDLISANGFIEYISLKKLEIFIDKCYSLMPNHGTLIIGSRNRLFNIVSFNKFTLEEISQSQENFIKLVNESTVLCNSSFSDIEAIRTQFSFEEQTFNHPETGDLKVSKRFQYTPLELINIFSEHKFTCNGIKAIHYHCVPPTIKKDFHSMFVSVANSVEMYAENNLALLPHSSSFMLKFEKNQ